MLYQMATMAEEYRKLADEADKRAADMTDAEARRMYRQLAANWREMADQADLNPQ
jgi:hypothetical protein